MTDEALEDRLRRYEFWDLRKLPAEVIADGVLYGDAELRKGRILQLVAYLLQTDTPKPVISWLIRNLSSLPGGQASLPNGGSTNTANP